MSEIIGIVGSGTMGNGIAQVAARAGYRVVMRDVNDEFLQRGMQAIDKSLQRDVDKQRLTPEDKGWILERISTTTELDALMKEGKAYVVDVRSQDSWDLGHIPGATLIPANDILKHVNDLPRDKMIVTYCS